MSSEDIAEPQCQIITGNQNFRTNEEAESAQTHDHL